MINSVKEQQCILLLSATYFGLRHHHQVEHKNKIYRVWSHAHTSWGDRRDQTNIYCQATVCWTCITSLPRTIKLGLATVGYRAKPLKYSLKKVVICYELRPDVQTYGHTSVHSRHQHSRDWHVHSKMPGCCFSSSLQNQTAMCKTSFSCM